MILTENQIRVPGKMYKVRVKCVSTRRLTTIEWIILNCTKKFSNSDTMADKTLKYAFEDVFQLQNSGLLIKPCLINLQNIKVIELSDGIKFDYDSLKFSDIKITDTGIQMLEEGLLPGEQTELPIDIYYNPLTGKMSHYDRSNVSANDVIDFGTASDYNNEFPAENVKQELQSGLVGGGKFIASKYRIKEIDSLFSADWDAIVTMTAALEEDGTITTSPAIISETAKDKIGVLFNTKEISETTTRWLADLDTSNTANIIGSGRNIKNSVLEVAKNGKFLFMNAKVYDVYKRNTSAFKDTIVVLWGSEEFSMSTDKATIINLPFEFPIKECAVLNEKGAHVCIAKKECMYEERSVTIPIVYEDKRLSKKNKIAVNWLSDIINRQYEYNIQYACLFTLPFMSNELGKGINALCNKWKAEGPDQFTEDIVKISKGCSILNTDMFNVDIQDLNLMDQIDFSDTTKAINSIEKIFGSGCIENGSDAHIAIAKEFIEKCEKPKIYNDLIILLQSIGIKSHDTALLFDDVVKHLYTKDIFEDILIAIASRKFDRLPEYFEYDSFFNEYKECLDSIELHISGLDLFASCNENQLKESIRVCPDLASLQSHVAELASKNGQLLDIKINVYDLLKNKMPECATVFMDNIKLINEYVSKAMETAYEELEEQDTKEDNTNKKIYIMDTCALIHNPDIFLYFADDEYVRIPTKVIDELGKIKDKRNLKYDGDASHAARIVAREINEIHMKQFNHTNKLRFLIENADVDLLPPDLDPKVPDNQILSVALKYKGWDTYIVSDDGVFNLAAKSQNIKPMKGEQFKAIHKSSYKSTEQRKREYLLTRAKEKINEKVEQSVSERNEQNEESLVDLAIDSLPVRDLKLYVLDFDDKVISYLESNKIKTIGDFRKLTVDKVNLMPAKGKQLVHRNTVIRRVQEIDAIIAKISK